MESKEEFSEVNYAIAELRSLPGGGQVTVDIEFHPYVGGDDVKYVSMTLWFQKGEAKRERVYCFVVENLDTIANMYVRHLRQVLPGASLPSNDELNQILDQCR